MVIELPGQSLRGPEARSWDRDGAEPSGIGRNGPTPADTRPARRHATCPPTCTVVPGRHQPSPSGTPGVRLFIRGFGVRVAGGATPSGQRCRPRDGSAESSLGLGWSRTGDATSARPPWRSMEPDGPQPGFVDEPPERFRRALGRVGVACLAREDESVVVVPVVPRHTFRGPAEPMGEPGSDPALTRVYAPGVGERRWVSPPHER